MQPAIRIHNEPGQPTPVVVGCPFPKNVDLSAGAEVRIGAEAPLAAQAVPLTEPTPGGVRWWELSFVPSTGGVATVCPADKAEPGSSALATERKDGVILDNGVVKVRVNAGSGMPPVEVDWQSGQGTLIPGLLVEKVGDCVERPDGTRKIRVLRNGPIRTQVELIASLYGADGVQFDSRLTLELWQGMAAVRVDWMLTNLTPGKQELDVTEARLDGDWQVGANPGRVFRQRTHGPYGHPRDVVNPDPVTLIADESSDLVHVTNADMLRDESEYPFYMGAPTVQTAEWLELRGQAARLSATLVDFSDTRPNALTSSGNGLSYQMVPASSPLTWPQGRRKEQHLLLAFAAAADETEPELLADSAARMFAVGRAQPTPKTLREFGCFELDRILERVPGRNARLNGILDNLCKLEMMSTKWDLGDTPDWHYTRGYAGAAHAFLPLRGFEKMPRAYRAGGGQFIFPDVFKYFVQPVWTNNEYDMIHALATEVLRTGRDDHFGMLRWTVRHNVEVDFVSYSDDPWHHQASPFHSHFHNRKGAITSHFWTQGLLQYYCLTGDRDAREVALALGDKIIAMNASEDVRVWNFDREIGWALLALCCLVEAGYDAYLDEARKIALYLKNFDRAAFSGAVKLSAGKAGRSLERQMVDCGFGYSSMVEALDRYVAMTDEPGMSEWFETLLSQLRDAVWDKAADFELVTARFMTGLVMAIGYERTGDEDFLRAGRLILESYLDPAFPVWQNTPASVGTENGQAKPCAMAYRGLHRLLGALDGADQLQQYEHPALREHHAREAQEAGA